MAFSAPAQQKAELLTANTVTPYILAFTDLRNGPAVLELPPASEDASLFGQVVDHWQITIADVGPSGIDKGKGGKLLLTPPGYSGKIPEGYIHVKSPSYKVNFAFRSIPGPDSNVERAYKYSQTLKMYYLSELPNPKPTQFVDPIDMRFPTLPPYDEEYFDDLYQIFNVENAYPRDKVMMGMLTTLDIEKGKPYKPDEETKKAMRAAAADAFFYMKKEFLKGKPDEPYYEDRQWRWAQYTDSNRGFPGKRMTWSIPAIGHSTAGIGGPTSRTRSQTNRPSVTWVGFLTKTGMNWRQEKPIRSTFPPICR